MILALFLPFMLAAYFALSLVGAALFSIFFAATYPIYVTYVRGGCVGGGRWPSVPSAR